MLFSANGIIAIAEDYKTDPTASTSPNQIRDPFQRKTFYFGERAWVMHNNQSRDGYLVLTSSPDGETWSPPTCIGRLGSTMGELACLSFDGAYAHFAWSQNDTCDLWYRRGQPSLDGSIALEPPSLIHNGELNGPVGRLTMPYVAVDTNGCPWIGVSWMGNVAPYTQARVYKSASKNGTWQTDFYRNLTLTNGVAKAGRAIILPLLDGKIAVLYQRMQDYIYLDIWNGSAWSIVEERASSKRSYHGDFMSTVAENDDIHLSYLSYDTMGHVNYRRRTSTTGWDENETVIVYNADISQGAVMNLAKDEGSIRVFWSNTPAANHIYYRQRHANGTWSSSTDWIAAPEPLTDSRTTSVSYDTKAGDNITFVYQVGATSQYHFHYCYIALPRSQQSRIDLRYVVMIVKAFGSCPGHLRWNPEADITGPRDVPDSKVDIRDVSLAASNFGKTHL